MAFNELTRLKLFLVDAWAEIMPDDEQTGFPVPVDYAWPGKHQKPTHLWMPNQRMVSDPNGMKAGPIRRRQNTQFDVVIEASYKGKTIDNLGRNVLQQKTDLIVDEIAGVIDEWVAANKTLGQTAAGMVPVDWAKVDSYESVGGPNTDGVKTIGVIQISYRIHPL